MQYDNVLSHSCLSVCVSVCNALRFASLDPEIFLLSIFCVLRISVKVTGSRSRSREQKRIWWYVRSRQTYLFVVTKLITSRLQCRWQV